MVPITDLKAKKIKPGDKPVSDGTVTGLRLEPGATKGRGKWIFRFVSPVTGKRRDLGLGVYPDVSISDARAKGMEARRIVAGGDDPVEEKAKIKQASKAQAGVLIFEEAARRVHEDRKPGWKNPKHAAQWIKTLEDYVFPRIGRRKVGDLAVADFAEALRPLWLVKPETATRVKQRCDAVMNWCLAQHMVTGNPVDAVDQLLPKQPGKRERTQHQPSMPWRDIPTFIKEVVRASPANVTRNLLEFVILTGARSGEARAMVWDEIDIEKKLWQVPANRMKAKLVHRVPLSERAIEILKEQRATNACSDLVFPSPRNKVLSDMVLTKFLRDKGAHSSEQGRVATAHGFRSSFRDWASENRYARDLAERALAHVIGNQTEAAYHRTDLLDQRRPMMDAWARFVCGLGETDNIVQIKRRRQT